MIDILALFQCLQPLLAATTLKQFSPIAFAMLVMTGRVTMLGMSRWAGKGGSYRTVQRFFYTKAVLFRFGWSGSFAPRLRRLPVKQKPKPRGRNPPRKSVRVGVRRAARTRARRKSNGRPSYCKGRVAAQLKLRVALLPLTYLALEGHFGNNNALCRARQCGLHLISKLRCDSALYCPTQVPTAVTGHLANRAINSTI